MGTLFWLSKSATSVALDTSEIVLLLFGVLLTVGLVGEYAKSERWKRHVKTFEMLVIIGVAGELLADGGIFLFSSHLQTIADQEIAELTVTAGNAKASAATAAKAADRAKASADEAKQKSDALSKQTDALTLRLRAASNKLDEIEQATLAEGPRWRLLQRGEDVFIKALKPFAGQQVTVVVCGTGDTEREALEQSLLNIFPKAGWNSPGYTRWAGCPNMLTGGNEIYFVAATDDSAEWTGMPDQQWVKVMCGRFNISHDAVNTLCDVLYKLRIFTTAWREKPLPEDIGIKNARLFFGFNAPDGPAELAYKEPGRIFLLIGPNAPMFTDRNKHPHKNAKAK